MPSAMIGGTIITTISDRMKTIQPASRPISVPTMAYSPPALGMRVPSSE
ncbi:hypothetical protein M2266_002423 [Streptomyces sp. SPB162]|nr:hypothetical protein [Streptomyces sp. SPB162]